MFALKYDFAIIFYFCVVILKTSSYKYMRYDKEYVDPKVIGGQDAKIEEFPFMVRLEIRGETGGRSMCGGSYIRPLWVLTASHCLDVNDDDRQLPPSVGNDHERAKCIMEKDEQHQKNLQKVISKKLIIHPDYFRNKTGLSSDLALIELQHPFNITAKAKIGKLIDRKIDYSGASVYIIGWGATKSSDIPPNVTYPAKLQKLKTRVRKMTDCEKLSKTKTTICIGEVGEVACSGDSGGPLIYENMVIGVCSYGFGCSKAPAIYGSVYPFLGWINKIAPGPITEPITDPITEPITENWGTVLCANVMCLSIVIFIVQLTFCQLSALF